MRRIRVVHYATFENPGRSYSGRSVYRTLCGHWYIIDALSSVAANVTCKHCKAWLERDRLAGGESRFY